MKQLLSLLLLTAITTTVYADKNNKVVAKDPVTPVPKQEQTIKPTSNDTVWHDTGNITTDHISGQDIITWNPYNKATKSVNSTDTSTLLFEYDGAGNRIAKRYGKTYAGGTVWQDEYYLRDAQGNILATYQGYTHPLNDTTIKSRSLARAAHDIYGSSRMGATEYYGLEMDVSSNSADHLYDTGHFFTRQPWYSLDYQHVIKTDSTSPYGNAHTDERYAKHTTGQRQYELTDHLGDVPATVSDKRAGNVFAVLSGGTLTAGDIVPGRYKTDSTDHCVTTTTSQMLPEVF